MCIVVGQWLAGYPPTVCAPLMRTASNAKRASLPIRVAGGCSVMESQRKLTPLLKRRSAVLLVNRLG